MRNRLLVVDGDPRSLRVLDVSLRSAGFEVETATTGTDAWSRVQAEPPDLVIADGHLEGMDGFELCARLKQDPRTAGIPFILVAVEPTLETKVRGLEAGADDYLVKPAYMNEVVARVRARLQRRDRARLATGEVAAVSPSGEQPGGERFTGTLADIGVVDLVQLVEGNKQSGILHLRSVSGTAGSIYFRQGRAVDAEVGHLSGIDALSRLFAWNSGTFDLEWKTIRRPDVIDRAPADLVMEGMQKLDERTRLTGSFSDLNAVFEIDFGMLAERLAEIPDHVNAVLRLCDGSRSLGRIIEECPLPDPDVLSALIHLKEEGIIRETPGPGLFMQPSPRAGTAVEPLEGADDDSGFEDAADARMPSGARPGAGGTESRLGGGREALPPGAASVDGNGRFSAGSTAATSTAVLPPHRRRTAPGLGQPGSSFLRVPVTPPSATNSPGPDPKDGEGSSGAAARARQVNVIPFPIPLRDGAEESTGSAAVGTGPPASTPMAPGAEGDDGRGAGPGAAGNGWGRGTVSLTQRGLGAGRTDEPDAAVDSAVPEEVQDRRSSPPPRDFSGPDVGSGGRGSARVRTGKNAALAPDRESLPVGAAERRGRSADATVVAAPTGEATERVRYPDDDLSDSDARDELGLPSRWRGFFRFLAVALVLGGLAALAANQFRPMTAPEVASAEGAAEPTAQPDQAGNVAETPAPAEPSAGASQTTGQSGEAKVNPAAGTEPGLTAGAEGSPVGETQPAPVATPPHTAGAALPPADPSAAPTPASAAPPRPGPDPSAPAATSETPAQTTASSSAATSGPPSANVGAPPNAPTPPNVAAATPGAPTAPAGAAPAPAAAAEREPDKANNPANHLAACRSSFARNRWRDAFSACTAAVADNPRSAEALTMLAHTELNRGRLHRAGQLAERAISLDPGIADAYVIVGGVYQDSGQNSAAKAAYRRYLELSPRGRYADELRSIVNSL